MLISLVGNIGSGKTMLTKILSEYFDGVPFYEDLSNNPFIHDFYENMNRWAFHLQIYFLNNRFAQYKDIKAVLNDTNKICVQDRTIYEDKEIFTKNLHESYYMPERDFDLYEGVYNTMLQYVFHPHLLVYLKSNTDSLKKNIVKRGRKFEENIDKNYLENLNVRYDNWYKNYDLGLKMQLEMDTLDLTKSEDINKILTYIEAKLPKNIDY